MDGVFVCINMDKADVGRLRAGWFARANLSKQEQPIFSSLGAPDVWSRTPYDVSDLSSASVRVSWMVKHGNSVPQDVEAWLVLACRSRG